MKAEATMRRRSPKAAAAGFTLIEVMISMFFLSFMVVELAQISVYARHSTAYARSLTDANMIAEGILEGMRTTALVNVEDPRSIRFDLDRDGDIESFPEECATPGNCESRLFTQDGSREVDRYLVFRTVTNAANSTKRIDVRVEWVDSRGEAQEVRLSTIRSEFH